MTSRITRPKSSDKAFSIASSPSRAVTTDSPAPWRAFSIMRRTRWLSAAIRTFGASKGSSPAGTVEDGKASGLPCPHWAILSNLDRARFVPSPIGLRGGSMASKRTRIIGGIAVVLILGSVVGFNVARENSKKVPVQTQKVGKRDLVKKDEVLAKIESERYEAGTRMSEAAVQSALAELDRAQADLDVSRLQLDRTKKMMADRLVSAQTYDQADAEVKMKAANVEAARRRVAQLQAQHDSNRDDLRKTTVFAPMDGVITSLPKEEGEVVIGAQSFSPTVIMTVADLSVMECEIMVDETDIRNLTLGQPAEIRVDALE